MLYWYILRSFFYFGQRHRFRLFDPEIVMRSFEHSTPHYITFPAAVAAKCDRFLMHGMAMADYCWLTELVGWLADWLPGCLEDWLTYWLTAWVSEGLTSSLVSWLVSWLPDCLTAWLTQCLADQMIGWLTDWLLDWLVDGPTAISSPCIRSGRTVQCRWRGGNNIGCDPYRPFPSSAVQLKETLHTKRERRFRLVCDTGEELFFNL